MAGRYQGKVIGTRPDGTPAQHDAFLIVHSDDKGVSCSASLFSFDQQLPCERVSLEGSHLRAVIAAWGDIGLNLAADGETLAGPLTTKDGQPSQPYQKLTVRRVSDLTISDFVPRLRGEEGAERSTRILQLRKDIIDGNPEAVITFWREMEVTGAPIIEAASKSSDTTLVTFVWRGRPDTKSVLVFWQRFALANPDDYFMLHLEGTDVWFKTLRLRAGTRIYYQLSPNDPLQQRPPSTCGRVAQADPLNARFDRDDRKLPLQRKRSLLELPGALAQPWYAGRPGVPRYTTAEQRIPSTVLMATRSLKIYVPPGYSTDADTPYGTMYLFDGEDPDGYVFSTSTIENLLAERKIPPVVVVRIQNPGQAVRSHDLECSDDYATFLNNELVPFIRAHNNVSVKPERTLVGGFSLGGLMAAYTAFRHSETFGMVLSQSGSFWYEPSGNEFAAPDWLAGHFASAQKLNLRFYLDAGLYELDFSGRGGNILVPNRHLRDVLIAKGYEVHYQEFPGEHDPINWRGTLADGLITLLGPLVAVPER